MCRFSSDIGLSRHYNIAKLAALIPPSRAEVERSFSLMNLILTPLQKRLLLENLSHCMRIRKFPRALSDSNYKEIIHSTPLVTQWGNQIFFKKGLYSLININFTSFKKDFGCKYTIVNALLIFKVKTLCIIFLSESTAYVYALLVLEL